VTDDPLSRGLRREPSFLLRAPQSLGAGLDHDTAWASGLEAAPAGPSADQWLDLDGSRVLGDGDKPVPDEGRLRRWTLLSAATKIAIAKRRSGRW